MGVGIRVNKRYDKIGMRVESKLNAGSNLRWEGRVNHRFNGELSVRIGKGSIYIPSHPDYCSLSICQ